MEGCTISYVVRKGNKRRSPYFKLVRNPDIEKLGENLLVDKKNGRVYGVNLRER